MPSKWIEGTDFIEIMEGENKGKIECLHCHRILRGRSAVGPHLTACTKSKGESPSSADKPSAVTFGLDEEENLIETLKEFRIKNAVGIARFVKDFNFENLEMLDEALRLSHVDVGKRQLIVSRWGHHIQKPIQPTLMQRWRLPQGQVFPNQPSGESGVLTEKRLLEVLDARDKQKDKENKMLDLHRRIQNIEKGGSNPQKGEIQKLREEIRTMQSNRILSRLDAIERNPKTDNATVQGIKSLENTVRDFIGILNPSTPLPKKQLEKGARTEIFEKISPEFVSES